MTAGIAALIAGGIVWAVGLAIDPHVAWVAYLVAVVTVLTVSLGAESLVLMAHLTDATWFVVLRPSAQAVAGALPVLAVLLVPLAFGVHALYPWLTPGLLEPSVRELVLRKRAYLNPTFFAIRAVIYVVAWLWILYGLGRWSRQQDAGERPAPPIGFSAAAAIVLGFTLTFASFDWLMSLRPDWSSTIYGVRVFAGSIVPALGLIALLMRASRVPSTEGTSHALASLLLSFVIFWFYIAFSQLLIVWIGNQPREIAWYLPRMSGAWFGVGVLVLIGHFVLPFMLLLHKDIKRSRAAMARLGVWLLVIHYVDMCWIAVPGTGGDWWPAVWIYPAALALVTGAAVVGVAWWLRDRPLVPQRDPDLQVSLTYEYEEA